MFIPYNHENHIRDIVHLTVNTARFVMNCETTDTILAARLLIEEHRGKRRPFYQNRVISLSMFIKETPFSLFLSWTPPRGTSNVQRPTTLFK